MLPGFSSAEEVATLLRRGHELIEGFQPDDISVFSTKNQAGSRSWAQTKAHCSPLTGRRSPPLPSAQAARTDRYFLDSANAVSFFFEEKAFDDAGALTRPVAASINKVGHALHDLDPAFRAWSRSPAVAALLRDLGYARPLPVQSMYICKSPRIGGEVVPHQVELGAEWGWQGPRLGWAPKRNSWRRRGERRCRLGGELEDGSGALRRRADGDGGRAGAGPRSTMLLAGARC